VLIIHPFNAISGAAQDVDKYEPVVFYKFLEIFVCHDFKRKNVFCIGAALKCEQKM
jgi:hypothetical protein